MKTITIQVPDNYEIQIVKKEEESKLEIKTYQDLIDHKKPLKGWYIRPGSEIVEISISTIEECDKNVALSKKIAKSMLAMATISQLMPYYGGEVTNEEWKDGYTNKFTIYKAGNEICIAKVHELYQFLAFHTEKQRNEFLRYNKQLVKDYLMID